MTDKEIFTEKVVPIMDRVRSELQHRQAEEMKAFMSSPLGIFSAVGPDGGMGATAVAMQNLKMTGEWNSKTAEDYVAMVREELVKEHINVTRQIEDMMIDRMVRDTMPKSSADYIIRKAAGNSIFGIANDLMKSPLEQEIEERGEALYGPTGLEKGVGWGLGAAADVIATGGFGGGLASAAAYVGTDIAANIVLEKMTVRKEEPTRQAVANDVPLVILPEYREEWKASKDKANVKEETPAPVVAEEQSHEMPPHIEADSTGKEEPVQPVAEKEPVPEERTVQKNTGGWQGILSGLGLEGVSDIGRNAGYILAMLPDMLAGLLTGETRSLGIKNNLMPLASIMAGMFVRNPLLKMTLIGLGGANLINKAGHEQLEKHDEAVARDGGIRYRQYQEEAQDPRIKDTQIQGGVLIASIDNIPVTIKLPDKVLEAYSQGALPMSTLANAVLARCDQMQQMETVRDRFEEESRAEARTMTQR